MRFLLHVLLITGITVGLSGCEAISGLLPGGGDEDVAVDGADPALPADGPEATEGATPAEGTEGEEGVDAGAEAGTETPDGAVPEDGTVAEQFDDPIIPETNPVGNVPLDLIASTDPEERVRIIQRDRPDPFDILRTTPTVELPEETLAPPSPPTPDAPGPGEGDFDEDGDFAPIPELVPIAPPPPPQPETARAVTVTGVVQLGSVPYAIVNAPNEPHSRYVRTGQFLSNGQVLVKRIDLFPGVADPVVVLEEFGIEVSREVGDPGTRAAQEDGSPEQLGDEFG